MSFNYSILVMILTTCNFSNAAPHPGMGSSLLTSPEKGLFYAMKGFRVEAPPQWKIDIDSNEILNDEFSVSYTSKTSPSLNLSLKTDTLKTNNTLEGYAKKWMKDYASYGFDILGAKTFSTNNAKGLVVDLTHKKKSQQLRQVIFVNKKTAVTLTCADSIKNFQSTLVECNGIFKSFSWLSN